MPHPRSCAILLFLLGSLVACENPAGLADQVDFTATPQVAESTPRFVAFRFVITNRSADTIWMAACDHRIRPDVEFVISGRTVDTFRLSGCQALYDTTPVALAAGESYTGDSGVPYQAGLRYVPILGVGRDRNLRRGARVQAAAFDAP